MGSWNKQVSFKNLVIGIVAGAAIFMAAAYCIGIKEVATFEGAILALLMVLFLIMCLKHYEVRRHKEVELLKGLKKTPRK